MDLEADEERLRAATRYFLLSMMREEADLDPGIRDRILGAALDDPRDPVARLVVDATGQGQFFVDLMRTTEDIAYFSRRHGTVVRDWLTRIRRSNPPS